MGAVRGGGCAYPAGWATVAGRGGGTETAARHGCLNERRTVPRSGASRHGERGFMSRGFPASWFPNCLFSGRLFEHFASQPPPRYLPFSQLVTRCPKVCLPLRSSDLFLFSALVLSRVFFSSDCAVLTARTSSLSHFRSQRT